jgi:Tetratricopeptide repeat
LAIPEKVQQVIQPDSLARLSKLALYHLGSYEEAEKMHRRAMDGREEFLGPDHADTTLSINSLGDTLAVQRKYQEEEKCSEEPLTEEKGS